MKPYKTELIKDTDLVKCWSILGNLQPSEIMELSRIPEERRDYLPSPAPNNTPTLTTI
jgi:hypothetical protein